MTGMNRTITIALILILTTSSLIVVEATSAEVPTVPQPSLPEFTVTQVDRSYTVPIKYTTNTDPFTGKEVTTSTGGNHVRNMTIDVTIKKQSYSPVNFGNGTIVELYYTVHTKGHFGSWGNPSADNGYTLKQVLASTSSDTVVTFIVGSENDILMGYATVDIPENGQEDFQVSAQVGYLVPDYGGHIMAQPFGYDFISFGDSGWSNTQTITYGSAGQTSTPAPTNPPTQSTPIPTAPTYPPTQYPTATPTQPNTQSGVVFGLSWEQVVIAVIAVAIVALASALVLSRRKRL
jgi:hypothetical protein